MNPREIERLEKIRKESRELHEKIMREAEENSEAFRQLERQNILLAEEGSDERLG